MPDKSDRAEWHEDLAEFFERADDSRGYACPSCGGNWVFHTPDCESGFMGVTKTYRIERERETGPGSLFSGFVRWAEEETGIVHPFDTEEPEEDEAGDWLDGIERFDPAHDGEVCRYCGQMLNSSGDCNTGGCKGDFS